jgi:hypothetical protein
LKDTIEEMERNIQYVLEKIKRDTGTDRGLKDYAIWDITVNIERKNGTISEVNINIKREVKT